MPKNKHINSFIVGDYYRYEEKDHRVELPLKSETKY